MNILLIDDDTDLLDITTKRLKRKGAEVQAVATLLDAQAALQNNPNFNGIICDLFLKDGENGIDFFESNIKDKFNGIFILVTGDDSADKRIEAYKESQKKFYCLQKPYSIDEALEFLK